MELWFYHNKTQTYFSKLDDVFGTNVYIFAFSHYLISDHEFKVTNLRKERETTITKVREESSQDAERVRILQKENAQLLLKLKTLTLELEEIHAQREKQGFETDNITRVQGKQITELSATIKSLEVKLIIDY